PSAQARTHDSLTSALSGSASPAPTRLTQPIVAWSNAAPQDCGATQDQPPFFAAVVLAAAFFSASQRAFSVLMPGSVRSAECPVSASCLHVVALAYSWASAFHRASSDHGRVHSSLVRKPTRQSDLHSGFE